MKICIFKECVSAHLGPARVRRSNYRLLSTDKSGPEREGNTRGKAVAESGRVGGGGGVLSAAAAP